MDQKGFLKLHMSAGWSTVHDVDVTDVAADVVKVDVVCFGVATSLQCIDDSVRYLTAVVLDMYYLPSVGASFQPFG